MHNKIVLVANAEMTVGMIAAAAGDADTAHHADVVGAVMMAGTNIAAAGDAGAALAVPAAGDVAEVNATESSQTDRALKMLKGTAETKATEDVTEIW